MISVCVAPARPMCVAAALLVATACMCMGHGAHAETVHILAFGDSLTEGMMTKTGRGEFHPYATRLQELLNNKQNLPGGVEVRACSAMQRHAAPCWRGPPRYPMGPARPHPHDGYIAAYPCHPSCGRACWRLSASLQPPCLPLHIARAKP
jgi:hypothetical protein